MQLATRAARGRAHEAAAGARAKLQHASRILLPEIAFFALVSVARRRRSHPFLNADNVLLILKYSSIYGIAAVGAAIVIISGGVDLAPGAVIALTSVVTRPPVRRGRLAAGGLAIVAGLGSASGAGLLSAALIVLVRLPPFIATLGVMGITRGAAFIITEGASSTSRRSSRADWRAARRARSTGSRRS